MTQKAEDTPQTIGTWPTAWGPMGGVCTTAGLCRIILPHYSPGDLRDLLAWEHPTARVDDAVFEQVAALCRAYFNLQPVDFSEVACDLSSSGPFGRTVLEACRQIPYGQTLSYSALAVKAGETGKQRAVAQALGRNAIPLVIPCHRVLAAGGRLGGYSSPGGPDQKARLLELEKRVAGA